MIVVDPRRTASVEVAEIVAPGKVLHLRPNFGTDYVLANAIARAVWEKGWWDKDFIEKRTDLNLFEEYKKKSLMLDVPYEEFMSRVEKLTGVKKGDIEKAAEWIASPKSGNFRRRTLTIYEKGVIWNYKNYVYRRHLWYSLLPSLETTESQVQDAEDREDIKKVM